MPAKSNVYKQISSGQIIRDSTGTFGSTTLTAAAAAGASTLTVTAITNFAVGDVIRVGSGEEMELIQLHASTAPSGFVITLATNLVYGHAVGEAVVEQTAYDMGDLSDAGVEIAFAGESQDIFVSTKRLVFATMNGYVKSGAKFSLPGVSLNNFAHATGALLSLVVGSGTVTSPKQFVTDGNDFAGDTNMSLVFTGVEMDGSIFRVELWGVDADYTGIQFTLARGQLSPIPCSFVASAGGIMQTAAAGWTPVTTIKPTKGDLFDALTTCGFFVDNALAATTLSSQASAGQSTIALTSTASLAAGDWMKFGTGETAEIWQLDSVTTIRGKFLRTQASGTTAKKQDQSAVAGVAEGGVQLNIGGSITPLKSALKRSLIGVRPGNANVSATIPMIAVTLSNFARALGIPQSAIVGGKLPINSANLSTDVLNGVYLTGTLLSGSVLTVLLWSPSLDLSNVATTLNNAGAPANIPITVKPASGIALLTV